MEENKVKSLWKTVLIVVVAIVGMILYVFVSSAIAGRNDSGKTADMYGEDSLEYVAEPVMKIYVWQRNDKEYDNDGKYLGGSSYFYDLAPLTLKPGEKVSTEKDIFDELRNPFILITVEYDGEIFGEYDIKAKGPLTYSGSKEAVPGVQYTEHSAGKKGSAPELKQYDSSFSSNDVATLRFQGLIYDAIRIKNNQWSSTQDYLFRGYGVDLNDYITKEKMHDVYPDAPKELQDLYRYVVTTHVTIHAKHPTKTTAVVATAVLAIRQISSWQGTTWEAQQILEEAKRYDENHTEFVVESYEQSDMFAFE